MYYHIDWEDEKGRSESSALSNGTKENGYGVETGQLVTMPRLSNS